MPVLDLEATLYGPRILALLTNAPASALPSVWQKLWRSASIRVATDGAANTLASPCSVKSTDTVSNCVLPLPNLISGDFDSISAPSRELFEASGVELVPTPDQIGGLGGRFDHTLATIHSLIDMADVIKKPIWILDAYNAVTVLPANVNTLIHLPSSIRKLFPGACGVMPIMQRPTKVTTTGFHWNLEDTQLAFGGHISSSNLLEVSSEWPYLEVKPTEPVILSLEIDWNLY